MKRKRRSAFAALIGTALAAFAFERAVPKSSAQDGELHYRTRCSLVEPNSLDGFVSNASQDTYQVRGEVRFKFVESNSMSRPEIVAPADSLIRGGETARVLRVPLSFALRPDEECVFDVAEAIRKE